MGDLLFRQPGILNGLGHGEIGIGSGIAHKTVDFFVDVFLWLDIDKGANLGAEAEALVFGLETDTGYTFLQRVQGFLQGVSQGRYQAHSCYDNTSHRDKIYFSTLNKKI